MSQTVFLTIGLMIEIHPVPDQAFSDADQTLSFEQFSAMMHSLKQ